MIDRGANGCVLGPNWTEVSRTGQLIDLTGLHDHTVNQLDIIHGAGVCEDIDTGPAILHVCQGAKMWDGKTILAPVQMEANGCVIHVEEDRLDLRVAWGPFYVHYSVVDVRIQMV